MNNIIQQVTQLACEYLRDQKSSKTSEQLWQERDEILAYLHEYDKEGRVAFYEMCIRAVEYLIKKVRRKHHASPSNSGGRIQLVLFDIYEELVHLLNGNAIKHSFLYLLFRKHRRQFGEFALSFRIFLEEREIPDALKRLALLPVEEFEHQKATDSVPYFKFLYLVEYASSFDSIMNTTSREKFSEEELICTLIELNLNHRDFEQYFYQDCKERLKSGQELTKLNQIRLFLKPYFLEPIVTFDPSRRPLNETLPAFLSAQMEAINVKIELPNVIPNKEKLKLFLSVSEFGALLYLLFYEEIFGKNTKKDIADHFAESFSSRESENISPKSLALNMKLETCSIQFWKKKLNKMLDTLDDFGR